MQYVSTLAVNGGNLQHPTVPFTPISKTERQGKTKETRPR